MFRALRGLRQVHGEIVPVALATIARVLRETNPYKKDMTSMTNSSFLPYSVSSECTTETNLLRAPSLCG